jgi:CelD/BcsL family acetyltransferase involved in cellulose biosynthesis
LAAVVPAGAQRFRVHDLELATTLSVAGAELVDVSPDVEIGLPAEIEGDAACAIIELRFPEPRGSYRLLRGGQRLFGASEIARKAMRARRLMRERGYANTVALTWERGVALEEYRFGGVSNHRIAHRFPLNAVVVGTRSEPLQTAFTAAVENAQGALEEQLEVEERILGASGVIVARARGSVLRVAIGPAAQRIEEQRRALDALSECGPDGRVGERVPWVIAHGRAGLALWSLEKRLGGTTPGARLSPRLLDDCLEFLVSLGRSGLEAGAGRTADGGSPAVHARVVADLCDSDCAEEILALGDSVSKDVVGIPRVFGHGDFWSGNLLAEDECLVGVVDWPAAGPSQLPLLDLFHLELNAERESRGGELGAVLAGHLLPLVHSGDWETLDRYCHLTDLELGPRQLHGLLAAYWLQAVARDIVDPDRDPVRVGDPAWRKANVEDVLETMTSGPNHRTAKGSGARAVASVPHDRLLLDVPSLEELGDEWRDLAERRGAPFLTPEWYFAWLRNYGERASPFVTTLYASDGSLRGLIPLVLSRERVYPTLSFAGADFGDYFHPVALTADDERAVWRAAAHQLAQRRGDWAILVADYVDDKAPWVHELVADRSLGLHAVRYHDQPSTYLSIGLAGLSWREYLGGRSGNLRSQLGRKLRALERVAEVRFRRTTDAGELADDMKTVFELHHKRWSTGNSSVFAGPRAQAFHLDFARAALSRGWLRLWILEVGGEAIAAWYGWRLGDRFLYYQAGFDPAWARYSPGLVLLARTIESAFEEGVAEYDMLLGDEPFKARFATASRTAHTLVLTRRMHPARAVVTVDAALRRLARRLPPGLHQRVRESAEPLLRRWPVSTAP